MEQEPKYCLGDVNSTEATRITGFTRLTSIADTEDIIPFASGTPISMTIIARTLINLTPSLTEILSVRTLLSDILTTATTQTQLMLMFSATASAGSSIN
ncbi:MAG: hypothetical protein HFE58_12490 [Firmicutes bacterium]|jgi:hypothetical protein|nr:hypothetical protein [Bacillota bacterium]